MEADHYVIRGGVEGRERLRVLARVLRPTTLSLFEKAGLQTGWNCLDAGCGGGDVAMELADRVGPSGKVVGLDVDEAQLELACREVKALGLVNIEFRMSPIETCEIEPVFDMAYARFLLTHLPDPATAVRKMSGFLKSGGVLIMEDIDFRGHFCHPDSAAFRRYVELYTLAVQRNGGDPHIGPRLPGMLMEAGCANVQVHVVQPAGLDGEVKLLSALTMENIAAAVLSAGLATPSEIDAIVAELYLFAQNPRTLISLPRIIQAWGVTSGG